MRRSSKQADRVECRCEEEFPQSQTADSGKVLFVNTIAQHVYDNDTNCNLKEYTYMKPNKVSSHSSQFNLALGPSNANLRLGLIRNRKLQLF